MYSWTWHRWKTMTHTTQRSIETTSVNLQTCSPTNCRQNYPPMKRFIEENVKAGRLCPSSSSMSSGTFMTPKQDPEVYPRLVHDYRELNENTIKDHTPLPRQDIVLERMVRALIRGR